MHVILEPLTEVIGNTLAHSCQPLSIHTVLVFQMSCIIYNDATIFVECANVVQPTDQLLLLVLVLSRVYSKVNFLVGAE